MPRMTPNREASEDLLPPGRYVVAMVWFKRKESRNGGGEFLNCKFEVCGRGVKFFDFLSLDVLGPYGAETATRWQTYMNAVNHLEEFELGSFAEGTNEEGDQNIREIFMGQPFAAQLGHKTWNGDTNLKISRRFPLEEDELAIASEWRENYEARGGDTSVRSPAPAADSTDDDWDGKGGGDGGQATYPDADDDIPF